MDKDLLANPDRRLLIDTAFRGGLAVALYAAFPAFSDIFRLWERANGLVPGWPEDVFEYPPIGALYFWPFTSLPSAQWAVVVNGLIMVLSAVGITWLLMKRANTSEEGGVDVQVWVASPALLLFLPINWDVLVALMSVLGVVALYQFRDSVSGVWHGLGTAFKIFPGAVVMPLLPLIEGWRRRIVFLASGLAVLAISYLVSALVDPEGWLFHLDFASSRADIQSTLWGVVDDIVSALGADLSISAVNTLSTVSLVLALLAVTYWAARAKPGFAEAAAVALMVLLVLNKTFKPQYVLWVLPFLAWIRASRMKVRILEATAILQFAVIYFALPAFLYVVETSARLVVLVMLLLDTLMARSGRPAIQIR